MQSALIGKISHVFLIRFTRLSCLKMNKLPAFLLLLFTPVLHAQSSSSFSAGELKMAVIDLPGNFLEYNPNTKQCGAKSYSAKENTVIRLVVKLNNRWVVKAIRAYDGTDQIQEGGSTYCISEVDLELYFIDFTKRDYGILAIPYKGRFSPFSIYPGGTLGAYIGRKFVNQRSTSSLLGFGGLSSIPLNNAAAEIVENKIGVTLGAGYVWYIAEGFQVGVIGGWDFFDGVGSWAYKYQPWASFNIGYSFTSNSKEKKGALQTLSRSVRVPPAGN